jgi:hypothetical protein
VIAANGLILIAIGIKDVFAQGAKNKIKLSHILLQGLFFYQFISWQIKSFFHSGQQNF